MEVFSDWQKILSVVADFVSIIGVTLIAVFSSFFAIFKKSKDTIAVNISIWLSYILKSAMITSIATLVGLFGYFAIEAFAFMDRAPLVFSLSFTFLIAAICLTVIWLIGTFVWTFSLRYAFGFLNILGFNFHKYLPKLEILSAVYGAEDRTIDVTEVLIRGIRDGKLDTIANNSLAGDPYPGIGKRLTVKYRFGMAVKSIAVDEHAPLFLPLKEDLTT